ncbi:PaaI family thioesterase [Blastococcus mobilis]|uniref:Acyl-coenzyme A thioesterase THEM4 n=1 Tax=Blastococcus mobilis TaxID=1938746 RepID=A0A238ZEU5_9ACTN|nr:hotdog domain-containing protein [Blastococcus mobilis]SNR81184.1 Thioesterase superfamily protein [Blastococcus mobilis]
MTHPGSSPLDERGTPRAELAQATRALQDEVRGTRIDGRRARELAGIVAEVARELRDSGADDEVGRLHMGPGPVNRGQTLSPVYNVDTWDGRRMQGTVTFARFHHGSVGTAHGGAIGLWADDVLGRLSRELSEGRARTACLHVQYRASVPVGAPVWFTAWADDADGRKRELHATLEDDGTALVTVDGLFVEPRIPLNGH